MTRPFNNVAVIGAGRSGWRLALDAARAGYQVVLEDVLPSKLRSAGAEMREEITVAAIDDPGAVLARIQFVSNVEDAVRDADLAIDGVPDELESKLEIFSMIDRMAPPRTIFCSPLQAVSLADVAACTYRASLCIGMRIEQQEILLVRASFTDSGAIDRIVEFWHSLGRKTRIISDAREFVPAN